MRYEDLARDDSPIEIARETAARLRIARAEVARFESLLMERIRHAYESGSSQGDIARDVGLTQGRVSQVVHDKR